MRVGILGAGLMGGKLGTIWAGAGLDVVFSYARSRRKLERLASEAGGNARAGTPAEAATDADAVPLAVHWSRFHHVLEQAGDLSGKVVINCSLPMNATDTELVVGHSSSGSEELAKQAPGARIVSAQLISDLGFDPVDAGPLRNARHIESFTMLVAALAYGDPRGPELAHRFDWC